MPSSCSVPNGLDWLPSSSSTGHPSLIALPSSPYTGQPPLVTLCWMPSTGHSPPVMLWPSHHMQATFFTLCWMPSTDHFLLVNLYFWASAGSIDLCWSPIIGRPLLVAPPPPSDQRSLNTFCWMASTGQSLLVTFLTMWSCSPSSPSGGRHNPPLVTLSWWVFGTTYHTYGSMLHYLKMSSDDLLDEIYSI